MPASYLTREDLELSIGSSLLCALYSEDGDAGGDDDDRIDADIAFASAMTQLYAESVGYTIGDTLGDTSADQLLKLATIGAVLQTAYSRGEKSVPLPEAWSDHPARRAYTDLLSGDLPLVGKTLDHGSAVGGWQFSQTSATNVDRAATRRTSRRNLSGY